MRYGRLRIHAIIWLVGLVLVLALNQGAVLLLPALLSILVEVGARRKEAPVKPADRPWPASSIRPDCSTASERDIAAGKGEDTSRVTQIKTSVRSGGVEIQGAGIFVGGDLVGRDKIVDGVPAELLERLQKPSDSDEGGGIHIEGGQIVVGGDVVGGSMVVPSEQADARLEDWLPTNCPNCGGLLSTTTVKNSTATTAECPFCGTRLRPGPRP